MSKCSKVGCQSIADTQLTTIIHLNNGLTAIIEACSQTHFNEVYESLKDFR